LKAAHLQNDKALYRLGILFYEDKYIKQDFIKSYQYIILSTQYGYIFIEDEYISIKIKLRFILTVILKLYII